MILIFGNRRQHHLSSDDPRTSITRRRLQERRDVSVSVHGHKFAVGETRTLHGLVDFPEFNGTTVEITAIRQDGPNGKAYYIKGKASSMVNCVYEYRLR